MNTNIIEVRKRMSNNIITRLGGNEMDIELDPFTVEKCIDLALAKLKQRSDSVLEESLVLLTLEKNQREYILPNEIVEVQQIYRKGYGRYTGSYGTGNMDPFAYAWTNMYMCGLTGSSKVGGLTTFELNTNYLKTAGKMFGMYMNYTFNPNTHKLVLVENPRTDNEVILLHSYTERPDYMILQDRYSGLWVENWALAEAKEILGQLRERFGSGLPSPMSGSTTQNGAQLKQESKAEKELLEKELMHFTTGGFVPSVFLG
jgi:hypothetical protein